MDSALSPRDIQSRIRAGESVAQVAQAAGVGEDRIEPFAGPVLAEREHIAMTARTGLLRRRGDGQASRPLSKVIAERMRARRLDADDLTWDAWRLPDRTWRVVARLQHADLDREAWFTYDARGRFNLCANADARWLVGEETPPGTTADEENTVDLNDELALVRATSEPEEDTDPLDAGYVDTEFAEVDGLYDIVGPNRGEMDALYDMLSGISEDSVRIYAELNEPAVEEPKDTETKPDEAPLSGPDQEALIETPETEPKKPVRRKRASIPAWDDILFGGPPKKTT